MHVVDLYYIRPAVHFYETGLYDAYIYTVIDRFVKFHIISLLLLLLLFQSSADRFCVGVSIDNNITRKPIYIYIYISYTREV